MNGITYQQTTSLQYLTAVSQQRSVMPAQPPAQHSGTWHRAACRCGGDSIYPSCPRVAATVPDHQHWRIVSLVWLGIFVAVGLKIWYDLYRKARENQRTQARREGEAQAWLDYAATLTEPPPRYCARAQELEPPAYENPPSYGTFGNEAITSSKSDEDMC